MIINVKMKVDAYTITPSEIVAGTAGSYGSAFLRCSFDESWNGLVRKASFYTDDRAVVVLMEGDEARVPDEVMAAPGEYGFLLSGHGEGKTILSVAGRLTVLPTYAPAVTPPASPTPSEMEQIYAMMQKARAATEGAAEAAVAASAAAGDALAAGKQAEAAARQALAAAARAGNPILSAKVDDEGHLLLTDHDGRVQDAGSVRGQALSGEYTGTGMADGGEQQIVLGFRPGVLLLSRSSGGEYLDPPGGFALFSGGVAKGGSAYLDFTEEGFLVRQPASASPGEGYNEAGVLYRFVALAESIPAALPEGEVIDRFSEEDGEAFQKACRTTPPAFFGQLMIGPGGRLFLGVPDRGKEKNEENKYGAWLPLVDDALAAASPAATTYSAEKIGGLASSLSENLEALERSLTEALRKKANLEDGCVKMNDYNVMGFVKTLSEPEDDPNNVDQAGFYSLSTRPEEWSPDALPENLGTGLLAVFPSAAGLEAQVFFSSDGGLYYRSNDLVHVTGWRVWKKLL